MSVTLTISPYWEKIVEHYYAHVRDSRDITIWKFLEQDYHARRTRWHNQISLVDQLKFENESDAMIFRLAWS